MSHEVAEEFTEGESGSGKMDSGIWQFTDSLINCQRVDKREQVWYLYLGAGACSTKHVPEAEPRPLGGCLL